MNKLIISKILSALVTILFVSNVWAIDLDSAKNSGLIGEQANGYLGIVSKPASKEVSDLVKSINSKRKVKYQEIANSKDIDIKVVEVQAGKKVLEITEQGQYYNDGSGWKTQ
jgi:uncharacterized protein YdbL (DUF1318 family)